MQNKWIQRLTLALAATALFVAAGGPTYAASKINGKNIKTKSVAGNKLRNNTLTGAQINESKLGIVPKAASADTAAKADTAANASSVSNGSVSLGKLDSSLQKGSTAAYGSFFGTGASVSLDGGGYNKNIVSANALGTGNWCVYVDWAAAGRTPANQGTPVIVSSRSATLQAGADQYNTTCPGGGINVQLRDNAGALTNGWFHILVP